ncbi:Fructose-1,6-bisphosphatase class 3 [Frankliniella fusca]|uniref:Fructose-1,6-bisphosphatase class 3 n=1 Tax=Frankliniella fusca TaxID=407009 RepID=A0AAE1HGE2_9NEOP|nr:Fructose-1,6-bisphosphatase class 3 [Frankliniella fusca]
MDGKDVPNFDERRVGNKKLSDLYEDVVRRLHEAYSKNQAYYNLRRREKSYPVGQLVYYANNRQSDKANFYSRKLAENYLGPCTVETRRGTSGYMLRNARGELVGPFHVQDLVSVADYKARLRSVAAAICVTYYFGSLGC